MLKFYLFATFIFVSINVFAESKIYIIRHAKVKIENPGWSNTGEIQSYKEEYNTAQIEVFDPEIVLNRIDHPELIDTVFCSPQSRAIETANLLFNNQVNLKIDNNLMELDYPVIGLPLIKMPVKTWLTISRISWMAGINRKEKPTLKQRKASLEFFSNEIIAFAETHEKSVVIAHGMVNRELIKILKMKGWKFENRDGFGNLSVNCLIK